MVGEEKVRPTTIVLPHLSVASALSRSHFAFSDRAVCARSSGLEKGARPGFA